MAVVVLQKVLIDNFNGGTNLLAGMAVALSTDTSGNPLAVAADRSVATERFLGVSYDDTATSGNTLAIVDPVSPGNYSSDSAAGLDPSSYSGPAYIVVPRRELRDLYDDTLGSIVTNATQGATRIAKRPIGVIMAGGPARIKTDQFLSTASTNGTTTDAGAAPTFAVESPLTYGAGADAGLWVFCTSPGTDGPVIGRVVESSVTSGLLHIRMTGLSESLLS
jgi:hypothetical protein